MNTKDRKWAVTILERAYSSSVGSHFDVYVGTIKVGASTVGRAVEKALAAANIYPDWEGCCLVSGSVSCEDAVEIDLTKEESEDKKDD